MTTQPSETEDASSQLMPASAEVISFAFKNRIPDSVDIKNDAFYELS